MLGALCVNSARVLADPTSESAEKAAEKDTEKAGDQDTAGKPREFTDDETNAADELRRTYSNEQQTLVNGLRYLLRPEFENELMAGRRFRPCVLKPFEEKDEAPLELLDELRLWAVLQSGMAPTGATDRQLTRFFVTPMPRENLNLAQYGIEMLLCRAIFKLPKLNAGEEAKARAEKLLSSVAALKDVTSDRSPLLQGDTIRVQWYANQMWLSLIMRSALDLGLEVDDRAWEAALKNLCKADIRDRGFLTHKNAQDAGGDLHPNLMALTAIGLASTTPEGVIGRSVTKAVEKEVKEVPELLARLKTDFEREYWGGSRLLLVQSMPADFAPERETGDVWRENLRRTAVSQIEPTGASLQRTSLAGDLGINGANWTRAHGAAAETALNCLALSGGLYSATSAPLAGVELSSLGRLMYAFAVLHAGSAREDGGDFEGRVNIAIEDGCYFLARSQREDGSFPGMYERVAGNNAACLLAMLHGGISRDDTSIQNGLSWLRENCKAEYSAGNTYSVALVLMFLQQYYEREQRETGIISADNPDDSSKARVAMWSKLHEDDAKLISKLLKYLDDSNVGGTRGGWGYSPTGQGGGGHSDNSCSQFAMLGYKAASLLGADIKSSIFEKEAERLVRQYGDDDRYEKVEYTHSPDDREEDDKDRKSKKTSADWTGSIVPGGWGYICGETTYRSLDLTAAGISSLVICMDELKLRGKLGRDLARKIGLTVRGAEVWMSHNYYTPEDLTGPRHSLTQGYGDGHGAFYGLYSVERGCVLAGIRKLNEEVDWYRIGGEALIEAQNMDGSWGREPDNQATGRQSKPQMVNTSMAILFLKKAAPPVITEHKKREKERIEREKQKDPKNPITSGPKDKSEPKPEADKTPGK